MTRNQGFQKWIDGTKAWLELQEWDTFATLTYRNSLSVPSARRAMERFLQLADVELAWWVTERGDKFGRVHNHALIRHHGTGLLLFDDPTLPADRAEAQWRARYGIARYDRYDPDRGAAGYCASYVTKKVCDYDLWLPSTSSPIKPSPLRND